MQHSHPTLAFKLPILYPPTSYLLPLHLHHRLMLLAVSLYLLLPLPLHNFLSVLQCIAGDLRARSTELLNFISSHPIDLICIQESNFNLFFSFQIPGFSALRSDCTYSRCDIFSTDVTDASGGVIIFVRHGLSFSELSTSSLSSLDLYPDYVEVNISLNKPSPRSHFLMFMLSLFALLRRIAEPISFLPRFFPPMWKRKRWNFHASASATSASTSLLKSLRFGVP